MNRIIVNLKAHTLASVVVQSSTVISAVFVTNVTN